MNYRHLYHAGNFADVLKHITLVALAKSFLRKENAFCYLDTHAGTACYDLSLDAAQKSKEYEAGIARIFTEQNPPALIGDYLSCVHQFNPTPQSLQFYPGSPSLIKQFLRPQDRAVLCELQAEEYAALRKNFRDDKQISIHHQDGYQGLKAFLPPTERRGLILIDPPYEKSDEFTTLVQQLTQALKRFETGVYAIWYPIKTRPPLERFYRQIQANLSNPTLVVELNLTSHGIPTQLNGCGMIIVNPPWQLDEQLSSILPWLTPKLTLNQGHYKIEYLI